MMTDEGKIIAQAQKIVLGGDPGAGGLKLFVAGHGTEIPSQVAADGSRLQQGDVMGLRDAVAPTHVATAAGSYWIGSGAHRWGNPLESLDHNRFRGSPGVAALFYAGLEKQVLEHNIDLDAVEKMYVGLPQQAVNVSGLTDDVRDWLLGKHTWRINGGPERHLTLREVKITTQPVAALFDYLLTSEGDFVNGRRDHFSHEVGIISIGMSTVEMLVVEDGAPVPRFTYAENLGVRRLLRLLNPDRLFSRGEMDDKLRAGEFNGQLESVLNVWGNEITGLIEEHWESGAQTWERFAGIVVVGGGAHLLRHQLTRKFRGKAHIPAEPVLAIARGLWKMGVKHEIPLVKRRRRARRRTR